MFNGMMSGLHMRVGPCLLAHCHSWAISMWLSNFGVVHVAQ